MSSKKLFWYRNKVMKRDKMTHFISQFVSSVVFVCPQSVWMCFLEPPSFLCHRAETCRSDERNSKSLVGVIRSVNLSPFASTNWLVTDSRSVRHCFLSCVWLNPVHVWWTLTVHNSAWRRLYGFVKFLRKRQIKNTTFLVSSATSSDIKVSFSIFGSPTNTV